MKKIVKICDKEYTMKSSAYTQFKYKNDTGRSLLKDIQDITKLQNEDLENNLGAVGDLAEVLLKMAYVMIEEADSTQVSNYEEFLKGLDGLFESMDWISEVIQLASSPLSRGIQGVPQQK